MLFFTLTAAGENRDNKGYLLCLLLFFLLFAPSKVWAQLNENCVVSVLNRTANVNPDGTWTIPNTPANFGWLRARATCVEGGVSRSGQSDFFLLNSPGITPSPEIIFNQFKQVPSSVSLTVNQSTLTSLGATAQLTVTAGYPDTSSKDVTAAGTGTVYTSTNPAIATVSADGLVTVTGLGRVLISASNEMVLSSILLTVTSGTNPDTDGDGLADDWERDQGLNPRDPVDAFEDPDGDGLTNKEEYDIGTAIRNADTDGDGLSDGEEVRPGQDGVVANPLLADSDGDGIKDRLEILTGSDPLNSSSYNLAQALSSLEAAPPDVNLVVNTILGAASLQLRVTGNLKDGSTIDLVSSVRGTTYSSSDLTVCNFGVEDGRIYAGANGPCVITVANSGFSDTVAVDVSTFSPAALSQLPIPGYANDIDVTGNFAYIAAGSAGLQIVDVSDRMNPVIAGSLTSLGGVAIDVEVVGTTAFIANSAGLRVVDVSSPPFPVLLGAVDTPGTAQKVAVRGNVAYVADGAAGLQIIDVSNLSTPVIVGSLDTPAVANGIALSGDIALVTDRGFPSTLRLIDVSNPTAPVLTGQIGIVDAARAVTADNRVAYVVSFEGGLSVVDIRNPFSPRIMSTLVSQFIPVDLVIRQGLAFLADILFVNAVPIVSIEDPVTPIFRAILDFSGLGDANGTGIDIDDNYLYLVTDAFVSLDDFGLTGLSKLFIGQYLSLTDPYGVSPTVSITRPAGGTTVLGGGYLEVAVEAKDDVAVARVDLFVNGNLSGTDTREPFVFQYPVPADAVALTLGVSARDHGGNSAAAEDIHVNVIPDPLTSAAGRIIDAAGNPLSGIPVMCSGLTALSQADGIFTMSGLPTGIGDISCKASFTNAGGDLLSGLSDARDPVPGGVIGFGDITLTLMNLYVLAAPELYLLNPFNGDSTLLSQELEASVIEVHPSDGSVYFFSEGTGEVFAVDPSFTTLLSGPMALDYSGSGLPAGHFVDTIAFDGSGQMHGLTSEFFDPYTHYLVKIAPATGAVTDPQLITGLPVPVDPTEGLTELLDYDPSTGYLWGIWANDPTDPGSPADGNDIRLVKINPATAAVEAVIPFVNLRPDATIINGDISVDAEGQIYALVTSEIIKGSPATTFYEMQVITIDKVIGQVTYLGEPIPVLDFWSIDFKK